MTTITLHNIDARHEAPAQTGETLLQALLRAGAPMPWCCGVGVCGACKSELLAGEVDTTTAERTADGRVTVLPCRCGVTGDCELRPLYPLHGTGRQAWDERIVVVGLAPSGADAVRLRVAASPRRPFRFRAGQHARLAFGDAAPGQGEAMFIASRPGLAHLDFYLRAEEAERLRGVLGAGAAGTVTEPTGSAALSLDDAARPLLVVAEAGGLASALGMLEALAAMPQRPPVRAVLVGAADGAVVRLALAAAQRAGIDCTRVDAGVAPADAITAARAALHVPGLRLRACVKAGPAVVRDTRAALFAHGVRPWDIAVDPLPA